MSRSFDPDRHHRTSQRLRGYDYGAAGAYFVTMVTHDRARVFGEVVAGRVRPSEAGRIAESELRAMPARDARVGLDAFVVMPDHVHAIVVIRDAVVEGATLASPPPSPVPPFPSSLWANSSADPEYLTPIAGPRRRLVPRAPGRSELGRIVGAYKAAVTRAARAAGAFGAGPLWQRNYHESVIRDQRMLRAVRRYIELNPARWSKSAEER